jgi:hypothetical protein
LLQSLPLEVSPRKFQLLLPNSRPNKKSLENNRRRRRDWRQKRKLDLRRKSEERLKRQSAERKLRL